jgi:hypothetical protein
VARSRRLSLPPVPSASFTLHSAPVSEEPEPEETLESEEDIEAEDFEEATPRPPDAERPAHLQQKAIAALLSQENGDMTTGSSRAAPSRSGSMATVRLQRRARLAEKLKEVFELEAIKEVWAGTSQT